MRRLILMFVAFCLAVGLTACQGSASSDTSGQESESASGQSAYDKMVAAEPAVEMTYPMTRISINEWTRTWNKPNALSYNYVGVWDNQGVFHASLYYVLKGLPVSMCTGLRPPYQFLKTDVGDSTGDTLVPAPSSDGAYYSGGDCERYYGFDANTGAYMEYRVPVTALIQTFSQPMVGETFNNAIRVQPQH